MLNVLDRMYLTVMQRQAMAVNWLKEKAGEFWREEKGSTSTIVVEIVMIGMVLVLAFVFRKQIGQLFTELWNSLVKFDDQPGNVTPSSMANPFG